MPDISLLSSDSHLPDGFRDTPLDAALLVCRLRDPCRRLRFHAMGKARQGRALVACMRKLLVILNSMLRSGTRWNPQIAPAEG